MQIRQLENFLEVVQFKSITKAAEHLFISQQSLSSSISSLEKELGYELFLRNAKGVVLTTEGELILEEAKMMVNTFNKWRQLPNLIQAAETTKLNIISPPFFNKRIPIFSPILIKYKQKYPNINFQFYEMRSNESFLSIMERKAHEEAFIAVNCFSFKSTKADAIAFSVKNHCELIELCSVPLYLIINLQHPLANCDMMTTNHLKYFTLATLSDEYSYFPNLNGYFNPDVTPYYLDNSEQILHLISLNPSLAAFDSDKSLTYLNAEHAKKLKAVPLKDFELSVIYYMLHRSKQECTMLEASLIKEIKAAVQSIFPDK